MTERASKIFQARQQKINEAFKRQRLDLPVDIEPIHRLTEEIIDFEQTVDGSPPDVKVEYDKLYPIYEDKGWKKISQIGKSTILVKGDQRRVINPDIKPFDFTAPDKPLTHETIYQAPADEIFPDNGRKTNGKDHKGKWGKHK